MNPKTNIYVQNYLHYCQTQKQLDYKTLKAYQSDLNQFRSFLGTLDLTQITSDTLEVYMEQLHKKYKPKTVKRKIASIKALFHYLEYKDIIQINPFNKMQLHFREPFILPKVIPLNNVETILSTIYQHCKAAQTPYQKRTALRDAAVIEFLFATGIRISELCNLTDTNVNLCEGSILIFGKGKKERRIQIGNQEVIRVLKEYKSEFDPEIKRSQHFFASNTGQALSDQSVRRMINKYTSLAAIDQHITPHMFRHTFATSLLEADVDIRFIQEMLGHSSITVTEIYTHVALSKQRDILTNKHPRGNMAICK